MKILSLGMLYAKLLGVCLILTSLLLSVGGKHASGQEDSRNVRTAADLVTAASESVDIRVGADIELDSRLRLAPGTKLRGKGNPTLTFAHAGDGIELTKDNLVQGLRIVVNPSSRAIFNDYAMTSLGQITLQDLTTVGQIQIMGDKQVTSGRVNAQRVVVEAADTRDRKRLARSRVSVLQGAIHVQNLQADPNSVIAVEFADVSAGSAEAPVRGSGVVVGGASDAGGRLNASLVSTGPIYIDGGLPEGTADKIAGGVFVLYGSFVKKVHNIGPVATFGVNNMVLDNWGVVESWVADSKLTSHGPSGIGFVNFGSLGCLQIKAPIETFGHGARGLNSYSGVLNEAVLDTITTHGDAAVGVAISRSVGRLIVRNGIRTNGSNGSSLVMGKIVSLPADGLSVLPGAEVDEIVIGGGIQTTGDNVVGYRNEGGWIRAMSVSGTGIKTLGKDSDAIELSGGAVTPITNISARSRHGAAIRIKDEAAITSLLGSSARSAQGGFVVEGSAHIGTSADSVENLQSASGNDFKIDGAARVTLEKLPYTAWRTVLGQRQAADRAHE